MSLSEIREEAASCIACSLHEGRLNPVFDKGNPNSSVMICGMVPATEENKAGLPFVGRAGKLLDTILESVGWTYDDVYITNLVKCFVAAGNPLKQEWVETCRFYLEEQIKTINPYVIITLGADSSQDLCDLPKTPVGKMRGRIIYYNDNTVIVPTYHPSYLLRKGGIISDDYPKVVADFNLAKRCLVEAIKNGIYS